MSALSTDLCLAEFLGDVTRLLLGLLEDSYELLVLDDGARRVLELAQQRVLCAQGAGGQSGR